LFIVEDGTIVENANSYQTVGAFRNYWLDRNVEITEEDAAVQAALVICTQYVDLSNSWRGTIVDDDQTLDFPRYGVYDDEDRWIDQTTIPSRLINAVNEYAKKHLVSEISPEFLADGDIIEKSSELGSLKSKVVYDEGSKRLVRAIPMADNWLRGLTIGGVGGNLGRAVRC